MKILIVILVAAGVAVLAVLVMDSLGAPGASGSHLRTAIAGGLAGMSAAFVGVGKKK
jgi:hypothetical protein